MTQVTVTAQNEIVNVQVSVSPEEAAKAFALQAEASAQAAEASELDAESAESAAALSESNAAASANAAALSASAAAASASDSEDSATDSSNSASAAASSALNSANSALASANSANAAAASESAAVLSAQAAAASESAAALSESSAALSAQASAASELDAEIAASAAALSAQAAAASELDAETAATQATAARDEIVNKIDFTGAQEGDLYRVNSLGVAVRINETEFLKSAVPFLKSPLAGLVDLDNVFAWDSFSRPNGAIGVADSGQSWQSLGLSPFVISNNAIRTAGVSSENRLAVIERNLPLPSGDPYRRGVAISASYFYRANLSSVVILKDINNYFYYTIFIDRIFLGKVVEGVSTIVLSQSISRDTESHGNFDLKLQRNSESQRLWLTLLDSCDGVQRRINLSSDYGIFDPSEWKYLGFLTPSGNINQSVFYKNVIMYNL
jgi:hypothetical protein